MKHLLITLTFVSLMTASSVLYAAEPGGELFFSLKANLWYQGVDTAKSSSEVISKLGEKSTQVVENKKNLSKQVLPEELVVALKNL